MFLSTDTLPVLLLSEGPTHAYEVFTHLGTTLGELGLRTVRVERNKLRVLDPDQYVMVVTMEREDSHVRVAFPGWSWTLDQCRVTPSELVGLLQLDSLEQFVAKYSVDKFGGGQTGAVRAISDIVVNSLMPLHDRVFMQRGDSYAKHIRPGACETFDSYTNQKNSWTFDNVSRGDYTQARRRFLMEDELGEYQEERARWCTVCEAIALEFEIPFSRAILLATAQSFAETHTKWNSSACY